MIPNQNKNVCKSCDISFWLSSKYDCIVKFCKGCKTFICLSEFDEKPQSSKCWKCRERGRVNYFDRKMKGLTAEENSLSNLTQLTNTWTPSSNIQNNHQEDHINIVSPTTVSDIDKINNFEDISNLTSLSNYIHPQVEIKNQIEEKISKIMTQISIPSSHLNSTSSLLEEKSNISDNTFRPITPTVCTIENESLLCYENLKKMIKLLRKSYKSPSLSPKNQPQINYEQNSIKFYSINDYNDEGNLDASITHQIPLHFDHTKFGDFNNYQFISQEPIKQIWIFKRPRILSRSSRRIRQKLVE